MVTVKIATWNVNGLRARLPFGQSLLIQHEDHGRQEFVVLTPSDEPAFNIEGPGLILALPPDHPFFEQVSFMAAEELPEYEAIVKRVSASQPASASAADREKLLGLPFSYIEPRHRLGLLDEELAQRILKGRNLFRENLPDLLKGEIEFYDPDNYNAASSLQDNILLGIQYQQPFGNRIKRGTHPIRNGLGGIQVLKHLAQVKIKDQQACRSDEGKQRDHRRNGKSEHCRLPQRSEP